MPAKHNREKEEEEEEEAEAVCSLACVHGSATCVKGHGECGAL